MLEMMMMTPTWTILVLLLAFTSIMAANMNLDANGEYYSKFLRKREVDAGFMRRYNHLHQEYKNNPFAFTFLKYFLRNRGQKREKRQIDNRYYTISGYNPAPAGYNNANNNNNYNGYYSAYNPYSLPSTNYINMYSRYDQTQRLRQVPASPAVQPQFVRYNQNVQLRQQQQQFPSSTTRPKTNLPPKRSKPFRPPMVFF